MNPADMLSKVNLRNLMILPTLMLLISLAIIFSNIQANTIPMGVDLKGGTLITVYDVPKSVDLRQEVEKNLKNAHVDAISDLSGVVGYTVEINGFLSVEEKKEIQMLLSSLGIDKSKISIRDAQPSISAKFLREGVKAVLFAFCLMALVIFVRFKTFVPSFAVVLSAFSDIVVTFAVMIVLGIQLTAGSLVALLLLIGYSVDTDILLTTRLLVNRAGSFESRFKRAIKTGLTMTSTTFVALFVLYIASPSVILKEIASVIMIGIVVDNFNTWIQNAGILQWYLERSK